MFLPIGKLESSDPSLHATASCSNRESETAPMFFELALTGRRYVGLCDCVNDCDAEPKE